MENSKSVLEMSSQEAESFFLKNESYHNIPLPSYFSFSELLSELSNKIEENKDNLRSIFQIENAKKEYDVNHILYGNKDGKLSYRPLQLIHPLIYVSLVKDITKEENWEKLKERFENNFQADSKIQCYSIVDIKSQTEQGTSCWSDVEQDSINLSLEYSYVYDTDIADCYGSIYTHSIAWAVETKEIAKRDRTDRLLGNRIDKHIQAMQNGQTNGIPQGSVLMDFIAEIVLGYVDELLTKQLEEKDITNYRILRYRDDYRVFVNNPNDGLNILKILSRELVPFGLKLNTYRTKENKDIISNVVDKDKLEWLKLANSLGNDMLKQLLLIRKHGIDYPNSGSLVNALNNFASIMNQNENPTQIISIALDIMLKNNHTISICSSIISKVLRNLNENEKGQIIKKIYKKIERSSNSDIAKVWLHSIVLDNNISDNDIAFDEKLCKIVKGESNIALWNNEWIDNDEIKELVDVSKIVNQEALSNNNQ